MASLLIRMKPPAIREQRTFPESIRNGSAGLRGLEAVRSTRGDLTVVTSLSRFAEAMARVTARPSGMPGDTPSHRNNIKNGAGGHRAKRPKP